jgi:DNA polymerase-3 subunit alpha
MPYSQVDRLCRLVPNNPASPVTLQEAIHSEPQLRALAEDEENKKLIDISLQLEGLYRHASTHAAGVVIGDRPLDELVPLYRDPRSAMPVTQFNMKYVEQAGLVKFDFLGLKTLTVMRLAGAFVRENTGQSIDLESLPLDDAKTYALLSSGEATGVFQLESSGMRDVLRKLRPDRFEDIIALVALYRPGPMDNIPHYIACKHGQENPDYLHPTIEPILRETFGVMIYQEQVMQIAQVLSGYSLGAADVLRRAMGKKIKSEMDAQRRTFVDGALQNGVERSKADFIFDQIAKFAGYGFNKSHAAAYALIAYQTAWLKANYPVEFFAATMSYELNNTDKLAVLRQELARLNIPLLPPDINRSRVLFAVEDNGVRYALAALKGAGEAAAAEIVAERDRNGAFTDLFDLAKRLAGKGFNKRLAETLVCAGALDGLHLQRAGAFHNIETALLYAQKKDEDMDQNNLFGFEEIRAPAPVFAQQTEWPVMQKLAREQETVGFYLTAHPLDSYRAVLKKMQVIGSSGVREMLARSPARRLTLAGVTMGRKERKSAKGNRYAFVQFSDLDGGFEVTFFSDILAQARDLLDGASPLLVTVDVSIEGEMLRYIAQGIKPLDQAAKQISSGICLEMDDMRSVESLHAFLAAQKTGSCRIRLWLLLDGAQRVEMQLPGGYHLDDAARRDLQQLGGVRRFEEFI